MKFDVTVNYVVTADSQDDALEIIQQLTAKKDFAIGTAKIRGFNLYEQPEALSSAGASAPC